MWNNDVDCEDDWEQDRHALADLLLARGNAEAAAIVAASAFSSVLVDNLDGGQYEVTLAVPPGLFDHARRTYFDALNAGCADVVSREHYRGLNLRVRRMPYETDWEATIIAALNTRWVSSERLDAEVVQA